jgi:hypothetical protein
MLRVRVGVRTKHLSTSNVPLRPVTPYYPARTLKKGHVPLSQQDLFAQNGQDTFLRSVQSKEIRNELACSSEAAKPNHGSTGKVCSFVLNEERRQRFIDEDLL